MLSKNEAKYIQSLFHKKTREAEGVFVVEGPKMIEELIHSDFVIKKVYAIADWAKPANLDAEVIAVKQDELQRLSGLQTANQVLAVVQQKKMVETPVFKKQLSLVLDNIQDPGNFGTIIRIADWFGIKQIIASEHTVEFYNPKVIQATMGSFTRVNVWYENLSSVLNKPGVPVFGALLNGNNIFESERVEEGLLVIGNESKGIGEELKHFITQPVTIPRLGGAESLNAAVATGIILSHMISWHKSATQQVIL